MPPEQRPHRDDDREHEPLDRRTDAARANGVVELARLANASGLELVTFQDHPYQPRFLDSWTLLSVVAAETTTVSLALNVANLPLRHPAMLAKSVASLDVLSGGRAELGLGLGAGAFWEGIEAFGGPRRTPGESVDALREAIEVIRAAWASGGAYKRRMLTSRARRPTAGCRAWATSLRPPTSSASPGSRARRAVVQRPHDGLSRAQVARTGAGAAAGWGSARPSSQSGASRSTTAIRASTTSGANWVPALARSSPMATESGSALR